MNIAGVRGRAGRGSHSPRRLDDHAARVVQRAEAQQLTPADLRAGKAKLAWYAIANATDDEAATVYVYDEIGGTFGVDAEAFAKDLDEITAPLINLRINSPGGALFDGIAIHNSLASHSARVVAYVDSLAASIASVIAMSADEIVMQPGAQMMIHDAIGIELGNAADMHRMSIFLDLQSNNIADIYRMRAGETVEHWRALMLEETWFFPGEAVAAGLADRVGTRGQDDDDAGDQEPPAAAAAPDVDALMARAHSLARFRHPGRDHAPAPGAAAKSRPAQPDVAQVADTLRGAFR